MGTGKNRVRRVRGPYAKKACVHCRKAKAKCDNGRPCRRCIKQGIPHECVDPVPVERKRKRRRKRNQYNGTTQIQNFKGGTKTNRNKDHVYPSLKEFLPFVPMSPKHQKRPYINIPPPPRDYVVNAPNPRNIYKNNNNNNSQRFNYPPPQSVNQPPQSNFDRRQYYYQQYYDNPPPPPDSQDNNYENQFPEEPDFLLDDKRPSPRKIEPPPPPQSKGQNRQVAPYYQNNKNNNGNFPINTYGMDGNYKSYSPVALTGRSGDENSSKQIAMLNPTRNQYFRNSKKPSKNHQFIQEPPEDGDLSFDLLDNWDINLDEMEGEVPMITNPTATTSPFQNIYDENFQDPNPNTNTSEGVIQPPPNNDGITENPMIGPPPPDIPLITMGGERYQVEDNYRLGMDDFLGIESLNLENNNNRSLRSRRNDSPSNFGMEQYENGNGSVGDFEDLSPLGLNYLDGDNDPDINENGNLPSPTLLGRNNFEGEDEIGIN